MNIAIEGPDTLSDSDLKKLSIYGAQLKKKKSINSMNYLISLLHLSRITRLHSFAINILILCHKYSLCHKHSICKCKVWWMISSLGGGGGGEQTLWRENIHLFPLSLPPPPDKTLRVYSSLVSWERDAIDKILRTTFSVSTAYFWSQVFS